MTKAHPVQTGHGDLIQPLPFSRGEYDRRLAQVRAEMQAQGLDTFVSFSPENINWLTGHDTPAYHYLQACVVTHHLPPVNLLRGIEVANTLARTWSRQAVAYADHEEPISVLADLLDELGGAGQRVGAESDGFFVSPHRFHKLRRRLGSASSRRGSSSGCASSSLPRSCPTSAPQPGSRKQPCNPPSPQRRKV